MHAPHKYQVETKHLLFVQQPKDDPKRKTERFWVLNKHDNIPLGNIGWFPRWRRYAFYPKDKTVFEQDCLRDIAKFIENETTAHRFRNKQKKQQTEFQKQEDEWLDDATKK